jgi:cell division protein FtsX
MKTEQFVLKVLAHAAKKRSLWLSLAGAAAGLFLLSGAMQTASTFRGVMNRQKDLLGGDFLVINKRVSLLNTLSGRAGSFDEKEQKEIAGWKGIGAVGAFSGNRFKVRASFKTGMQASMPGLSTDMFLEAVPDAFIDTDKDGWGWEEGDTEVPLIIPADYLKLYNFGFAQGQGLPLIPESVLQSVSFDLSIYGKGQMAGFRGRIAGFTNRIQSVLVPQEFMDYANARFGEGEGGDPGRLILRADDPSDPALTQRFAEAGYEMAGGDRLRTSRINSLLMLMMAAVLALAMLMIVLALLGIVQFAQILVYRSARDLQVLYLLGCTPAQLAAPLQKRFTLQLGLAVVVALALTLALHLFLHFGLKERGFESSILPSWEAFALLGIVLPALWWLLRRAIASAVREACAA